MNSIVVVNGEVDWQTYLPGIEVHQRWLGASRWLYRDGALWVFDLDGAVRVEAVLWRLGAVKPEPAHRTVLELIRLAGIPCLNPARVLLRGYDRLGMLNELREAGLPIVPFAAALGEQMLDLLHPALPAVVKIGNFHGGFGKALARDETQWADVKDLAFVSDAYVTVEPYIPYVRDIRCLAVGERMWAMARRGASWKANTETTDYEVIGMPDALRAVTAQAMAHFGADLLGLDFLEDQDGHYTLLESNDVPGLTGFPNEVRVALARRLRAKLEG